MKYLISGWIDLKKYFYKEDELPYEFQLINQGTKDGFSRSIFEQKCYNIEQTLVVMKIKETEELVGGYNPVCWSEKGKSPNDTYCIKTDKSFIFKIDEKQLDNSIQSNLRFNESIVPTQKFVETRKFAEANLVMINKKFFY